MGALTWGTPRGWDGFINVDVALTGVQASGALGTSSVSTEQNLTLTGVAATASLSTGVEVEAGADHPVTGVAATTTLGTVTATAGASGQPAGLQATGSTGTLGFVTTNFVNVTGVSASNVVGTATVTVDASVTVIGVSAIISTTTPLIWQNIDDDQTPNWSEISTEVQLGRK